MISIFTELDQLRTDLKNKDKEILELKQELKTTTEKMKHFDSKQNNLKNRLQRARKGDFWINVKEYLPDLIGCYIVYFSDNKGIKRIGWAFRNSSEKWFVDQEEVFPTHWQNIPKQPLNK